MSIWKTEIYCDNRLQELKSEYRKLLSVKVSEEAAERLVVSYATHDAIPNSWEEGRVWLAMALTEWELGRLSEYVKLQAMKWLHTPDAPISADALQQLEVTLLSPQPLPPKIRPPRGIRKCPFPTGSLLAYRIISNDTLRDTPFWEKYVLLRVIKIIKTPVTRLAPDAFSSESMLVGLYDWIGDTIPNANIVSELNFIPIVVSDSASLPNAFLQKIPKLAGQIPDTQICTLTKLATTPNIETCCCLDWMCVKGIDAKAVFTLLECDEQFANSIPAFINTEITSYSFAHSIPFDVMLKNRFSQMDYQIT